MELFLQEAATLAHFDDGVIETIEALSQPAGAQLQCRLQILGPSLLEPMKHDAQARELAMQTNAASSQPAERLTQISDVVGQDLFFDLVERLGDALGDPVHR